MGGVNVGSVSVSVVPDASKFGKTLAAKLVPQAAKIGAEVGKIISKEINSQLKDIDFGVDADTAAANAKITELEARLDRLEHKKVSPKVEVNGFVAFQNAVSGTIGEVVSLQNVITALSPVIATTATVALGAVGGLGTAFTAAGVAAGAFGAVAITTLTKVKKVEDEVAQLRQKAAGATGKQREAYLKQAKALEGTLTPAQRHLADAMDAVEQAWDGLQQKLSPVIFKALKPWLDTARKGIKLLGPIVKPAAAAIATLGKEAKGALESPFWKTFFRQIGGLGGTALTEFGKAIGHVAVGLAALLKAFMPLARQMLPGLTKLAAGFTDWAVSLNGSSGFAKFIDYVKANGPKILAIIGNLAVIVGKAVVALLPLGALMSTALAGITSVLAKLSPNQMLLIATGIAVALAVATGGISAIVTAIVLAAGLIVKNWGKIKAAALAVAHWFTGPFVQFFVRLGKDIAAPFLWFYRSVIKPVFKGIMAVARPFVILFKVQMILIQAALKATGLAFSWLWRKVVVPVFNGIKAVMRAAWSWISKNVISPFVNGIRKVLGPVFSWLHTHVITPQWNAIKKLLHAGWQFVSRYVISPFKTAITKTLPNAFQSAVRLIGKFWNGLKAIAKAPINFVIGTIYDKGIRGVIGAIAKFVGEDNPLPKIKQLATGGHVRGPGTGTSDSIPAMLSNGEFVMNARATRAFLPMLTAMNNGVPAFASGGLVGWITHPLENLKNAISGPVNGLLDTFGHNSFVKMLAAIPGKITGDLVKKIKSMIGDVGSVFTGKAGGGVQRWAPLVSRVLAMLNQPAGALQAVLVRMQRESGGNPTIQNNWDSNARAGHPSIGLMQTIGPTFNAYAGPFRNRGITDPLANIYAGVNYAIHRYGRGWIHRMTMPGGYALGGIVKPQLFDSGGYLPPGLTLAMNATRRPEPVFTGQQFEALQGKGDGTGALMRDVYITEQDTSGALDTLAFRLRHARRGGVYADI